MLEQNNGNINYDNQFKDHVKSVLRIFSAQNKNNCWDPTAGILIKLKQSLICIVFIILIQLKLQRSGPDNCFCYEQKIYIYNKYISLHVSKWILLYQKDTPSFAGKIPRCSIFS